jgi:lysozyme family protein
MDNFEFAFTNTMVNEGGFVLHKNEGDRGGWTFAGIAENFWPDWEGWPLVKSGQTDSVQLTRMVMDFYREHFWEKIKLHQVTDKVIAYTIFDFAVNAGARTAAKLVQLTVGAIPDGVIGPKTLELINASGAAAFEMKFALVKIGRYVTIVDRNRSQERFLRGWIKRTLKVLAV